MGILNQDNKIEIKDSMIAGSVFTGNNYTFNYYIVQNDEKVKIDYSENAKYYLNKYKGLEGYLFATLFKFNDKKYNPENNYTECLLHTINWIIGKEEYPKSQINELHETIRNDGFELEKTIDKRWHAMNLYFEGKVDKSKEIYDKLLNDIEKIEVSDKYYKDDILLDGRNISALKEFKFQDKIDKLNHLFAIPIYDRLKTEIYENANKYTFKYFIKDKNTVMYGLGLEDIFNLIQNYIEFTLFYGSITYLKLTRTIIHNVLSLYAISLNEDFLYEEDLSILVLMNDNKEIQNLISLMKKRKIFDVSRCLKNILSLEKSIFSENKINYYCIIMQNMGNYLDDGKFNQIYTKLFNYISDNEDGTEHFNTIVKALSTNINRVKDKNSLFKTLLKLRKKSEIYSNSIIDMINNLYLEGLNEQELIELEKIIDILIKNDYYEGRLFNTIYSLEKITKDNKYNDILNKKNNTLIVKLMNYDEKAIAEVISITKERHKESSNGLLRGYAIDYYLDKTIFNNAKDNLEIKNLILKEYIPLVGEILNSKNETGFIKIKQLKQLGNLLFFYNDEDIITSIKKSIGRINVDCMDDEFRSKTSEEIIINKLMVQFLIGEISQKELLFKYNYYCGIKNAFLEEINSCIEILYDKFEMDDESKITIYNFFISSINYKYDTEIRSGAYCLSNYLLKTDFKEKVVELMSENAKECTEDEAREIIRIVKFNESINKVEINKIKESLILNPDYSIKFMEEINLKDR